MGKPKASDTGVLWNAVGKMPVDESTNKMKEDGWVPIAEDDKKVVLKHKEKKATLYVTNGRVGMIQIDRDGKKK